MSENFASWDAADFNPAGDFDAFCASVPAKWCVYLMEADDGRPVQLLCVKNLRASLRRRLGEEAADTSNKRVDYRNLVRRVRWRRVDSDFEQDWVYLEAARSAFPESYGGVLGFSPAWFVHVNPQTDFPRYTKTTTLTTRTGRHFGPIPDKHSAQKLVHAIEDLFDLCRDFTFLTNSPAGPCPWRQMNKCVGPCDGTVSLARYRSLVAHSAEVLSDLPGALAAEQLRMREAAKAMAFEEAGKIKQFADDLEKLTKANYRHVRPLEQFAFLAVMPSEEAGKAKLFACVGGSIEPVGSDDLATIRAALTKPIERPLDDIAAERVSLVTAHLFSPKNKPGAFLHRDELDSRSLAKAIKDATKPPKRPVIESGQDEGEVRGVQSFEL